MKAKLNNAKEYWKLLKESARSKLKNLSADHFDDYFKAINNPNDPFFQPDDDIVYFNEHFLKSEMEIIFDELNITVTETEIRKVIKQLKNGKSGGPDVLLNEFFIHGVNELLHYLYNLFNKVLDLGHFPEVWSEGYVVPIHKKGKLVDVNNFRGITLLSTLGKLFMRVLNNRLTTWAQEYYVYIEAQTGFRANMSTTDNVFVLHGIINHMLNSNKKLFCAFVDFTKAFDYVVFDIVWYKLIKLGIGGKILNVIMSMYKHVKSKVSEGFECVLGVRQGECLSPFLFAMYLNDLEEEFRLKGSDGIDMLKFSYYYMLMILYFLHSHQKNSKIV